MADEWIVKTDEEIRNAALEEWYGVLATLWTAIGKPIDKRRLELYGQDLGDVPLGLLDSALRRVRNENVYANVPSVGVIRQAVNKELEDSRCYTISQWRENRWPAINFAEAAA